MRGWRTVSRRAKFGAIPTTIGAQRFASRAEARRGVQLRLLAKLGAIVDLECQPAYPIVVAGVLIGRYIADFRYYQADTGELVVEDVKSRPTKTPVYRLKKRLIEALYPWRITEVTA